MQAYICEVESLRISRVLRGLNLQRTRFTQIVVEEKRGRVDTRAFNTQRCRHML